MTLVVLLASLVVTMGGCAMHQMGETASEGHRRHIRNLRLERQAMAEDIDLLLMTDDPSTLSERVIP